MYVIVSNTNSFGAKAIDCYHHEFDAISSGYKHNLRCFFPTNNWYSYFQDSLNPVVTRIFWGKPMENHQGKPLEIARLLALYSAVGHKWGC